jgi:hypothetical protein
LPTGAQQQQQQQQQQQRPQQLPFLLIELPINYEKWKNGSIATEVYRNGKDGKNGYPRGRERLRDDDALLFVIVLKLFKTIRLLYFTCRT